MSNLVTSPEITLINGIAYCTSLQVADHFDKRHDNIVRDIEATIAQVLDSSNNLKFEGIEKLFQLSEYEITTGIGAVHKSKKPCICSPATASPY